MSTAIHIPDSDTRLKHTYLEQIRKSSESQIKDEVADYYAKYFAIYHLQTLAASNPGVLGQDTVQVLATLFDDRDMSQRRQGLFLFRQAAETLTAIIQHANGDPVAGTAYSTLKGLLKTTTGHAHRAATEALGSLPFTIKPPDIESCQEAPSPLLSWERLIRTLKLDIACEPKFLGRSLVATVEKSPRLLVIKLARCGDAPRHLSIESRWMAHLRSLGGVFPVKFAIPRPLLGEQNYLFRLRNLPARIVKPSGIHPQGYAIAFLADSDYFRYPNHGRETDPLSNDGFKAVLSRNARLLGRLAAMGIIHAAPTPLFHNRIQARRRRDLGLYEWFRAGRLDRWLESCAYPNLGVSGLRDFEHLESFNGSQLNLYRSIGNHFLSLFLVTGSFFRNKEKDRIGKDDQGNPVDVRYLFDRDALKEILEDMFHSYYHGFVDSPFQGRIPVDMECLVSRMIDEMGVDRYMEEILRIVDQDAMSGEEFIAFLKGRGKSEQEVGSIQKGRQDITLLTGPHLGDFNRPISLPEMTESIGTMSALCMAGKYWKEVKDPGK